MPGIPGPDPFGVVALDQLADDRLDASAGLDQPAGQARHRPVGRARRGQQPHALVGQQSGPDRAQIGPVPQRPAADPGQQLLGHGQVMHVRWSQQPVGDHSWPAHP
jgi:hypothetical protein